MDVLQGLSISNWIMLAAALVLFCGPGFALVHLVRGSRRLDFTVTLAFAISLALAFWAILFGLLDALQVSLADWAPWLIGVASWLIGGWLWSLENADQPDLAYGAPRIDTAMLWLVVVITGVASLLALRGIVVQPGSDGYHHTLIAQAIADQGGLPSGFFPLTPVVTNTYHFGFHVLIATVHWLSGISVVALVPLLAQLLKAVIALSVAVLAETIGGRRFGGVVAAAVTGLIAVFPAYYVNWGRNTQLTGLILMAVLLAIVWIWSQQPGSWRSALAIGILAAGIGLTHYRVVLMAAPGAVLIVVSTAIAQRWRWSEWRTRLLQMLFMAGVALLCMAPWLWHILRARGVGFPAPIDAPRLEVFSLDRFGATALGWVTNIPLLVALAVAGIWGIWRRNRGIIVMILWLVLLLILSQPWAIGRTMDTVTVVSSAFVPVAVVIGLAAADWALPATGAVSWRRWGIVAVTAVLAFLGGRNILTIVEPSAAYVTLEDLPAVDYVRTQTPADARFMVNTFRFPFAPDYIVGSDAGSWLPVLAQREAVTAPLTYPLEGNVYPDYETRINALADVSADLTAPAALALLRQDGITHVFIGKRGGPITADRLLSSPDYELLFQNGPAYVFRLLPPSGQ